MNWLLYLCIKTHISKYQSHAKPIWNKRHSKNATFEHNIIYETSRHYKQRLDKLLVCKQTLQSRLKSTLSSEQKGKKNKEGKKKNLSLLTRLPLSTYVLPRKSIFSSPLSTAFKKPKENPFLASLSFRFFSLRKVANFFFFFFSFPPVKHPPFFVLSFFLYNRSCCLKASWHS